MTDNSIKSINIAPDGEGMLRWIRKAVLPGDRPMALRLLGCFNVTVDGVSRPIGATEAQEMLDSWEEEADSIKRVGELARAQEARFVEEHDGESSAEYFGESGVSDAQDAAMREREETE